APYTDLFGINFHLFNLQKAKDLLDWEPKISLHKGLPMMVSDLKQCIFGDHKEKVPMYILDENFQRDINSKSTSTYRIPIVLRYFPLTPYLQRLFMCEETTMHNDFNNDADDICDDDPIRLTPLDGLEKMHLPKLYT
ncbi:unnamed protein product, partial [Dovyalis caffra]